MTRKSALVLQGSLAIFWLCMLGVLLNAHSTNRLAYAVDGLGLLSCGLWLIYYARRYKNEK